MEITDYLIEPTGKAWKSFLAGWRGLLPVAYTLWIVNRLGDPVVVMDDGDESVHFLNVGAGTLTRVADTRDEFAKLLDQEDNARRWLAIPLIDQCAAAGKLLGPDQCYGYKLSPMRGGAYQVSNLLPTSLAAHYARLSAEFAERTDRPDGASAEAPSEE